MRARVILAAVAVLVVGAAQADAKLFERFRRDIQRNRCWPAPFLGPDRVAARAPFAIMINNGWRTQNTLADEHFDPDTGSLNEAGQLKVRGILSYSPPEHRTVFVLQAHDDEISAARNRSVNQFVSGLHGGAGGSLVAQTMLRPRDWPADYISTIGTRFHATTPDPRLPASTGGGMGGAGGGGGGGGF